MRKKPLLLFSIIILLCLIILSCNNDNLEDYQPRERKFKSEQTATTKEDTTKKNTTKEDTTKVKDKTSSKDIDNSDKDSENTEISDKQENTIELTLMTLENGSHKYYHELLSESLKLIGYDLKINELDPMPQKRIINMLDNGEIDIHWMVQSSERDSKYTPIEVGITNQLIGHRVLFIKKGTQEDYNDIRNLSDFRELGKVGGFGKNWFDVAVWNANDLPVFEKDGDWRELYAMVEAGNRGVDYFSRGINEIVGESVQHPELDVEENLMFVYDRDFRFYLSSSGKDHYDILADALEKAKEAGLIDKLIRKYWPEVFNKFGYDSRVKLPLEMPGSENKFIGDIELTLMTLENGSHKYYHELLSESLKLIKYDLKINELDPMPQKRIISMLDNGEIDIHWMVQSSERDRKYTPIEVGITNQLIGHRVLFIKKGTQPDYYGVSTLSDFRELGKVGGFGKNWFDVAVWNANDLPVFEKDGDWRELYAMVEAGNRGVDYFSRGINEIVGESVQHPELDVEENLMFVYDRDFRFYLSSSGKDHYGLLADALEKAKEAGLIDKLIRKYWPEVFNKFGYDSRVKLRLETP